MSLSLKSVNVITLFAEDLAGTRSFYEEVLGLPVIFEEKNTVIFKFENVMINLVQVSRAPELIAPTAVASPKAGSRFVLAMFVDDVDAVPAPPGEGHRAPRRALHRLRSRRRWRETV